MLFSLCLNNDLTQSQNYVSDSLPEIAIRYGDGANKTGVEFRFRRVKSGAKLLNEAVALGIDPFNIPFNDGMGVQGGAGKCTDFITFFLAQNWHKHIYILELL